MLLRISTLSVLLLTSFLSFGQTTTLDSILILESFETDGNGTRYQASHIFNDGPYDHFDRTDGSNINHNYSNQDQTYFWAGEDLDDGGGDGLAWKTLTFDSVDISSFDSVNISLLVAFGTTTGWDSSDSLVVEYRMNGMGTWHNLFYYSAIASGSNQPVSLDTDGDGLGDTPTITNVLTPFDRTITPASGSYFQLRVMVSANSSSEEFAFDNIKLKGYYQGTPPTALPEPSNHVTGFGIDSASFNYLSLEWTDAAAGNQLPDGYLIVGKKGNGTYHSVADGTPVGDDLNFADNDYSKNITHIGGSQSLIIGQVESGVNYSFQIYPYTNSGSQIDYKTLNPPMLSTTIPLFGLDTILYDGFDNCSITGFTQVNQLGPTDQWNCGQGYFEMNGFGDEDDVDWLVSPVLPLSNYDSVHLSFETQERFGGNDLELYYSVDYHQIQGQGSPTWKKIDIQFNDVSTSSGFSNWFNYGFINVDTLSGTNGSFGFKYTGTSSSAENWRVDNFFVGGNFLSDQTPPIVLDVHSDTITEITVVFNEPVNDTSATSVSNYGGIPAIGSIVQNTIGDTVWLNLSSPLTRDDTLLVSGIKDLSGNTMQGTQAVPFVAPIVLPIPHIFITEIADPNNDFAARYVELYNAENSAVNLNGWKLGRYTNNSTTASTPIVLQGSIPAHGHFIICNNASNFSTVYGISANQNGGSGGPADSNGDDNIYLEDANGSIVDFFGRIGEDGTGTDHEFEDGRAERKANTTQGNATYDPAEWNIWNDNGGNGTINSPQNAPGDFDPGMWIGNMNSPVVVAIAVPSVKPCLGDTVMLDVMVSDTAGTYSYQWYPLNKVLNGNMKQVQMIVDSPTVVVVEVSDSNSTWSDTVLIEPKSSPKVVSWYQPNGNCAQGSFHVSSDDTLGLINWINGQPINVSMMDGISQNFFFQFTDSAGCTTINKAKYRADDYLNSYTLLAKDIMHLAPKNKIDAGAIGVKSVGGIMMVGRYSGIYNPYGFYKADSVNLDPTVPTSQVIKKNLISVKLPKHYTSNIDNSSFVTQVIRKGNTKVISGNNKNIVVKSGATVTLDGKYYGDIFVDRDATLKFNNSKVQINKLIVNSGKNSFTSIEFMQPHTELRVKSDVILGARVNFNNTPSPNQVMIYIGGHNDAADFKFKGKKVNFNANVYVKNGSIKSELVKPQGWSYMNGYFIADTIALSAKQVRWMYNDCSINSPLANTNLGNHPSMDLSQSISSYTNEELNVYPNPSTGLFTVQFDEIKKGELTIEVFSIDGSLVFKQSTSMMHENKETIVLSDVKAGIYFLKLKLNDQVYNYPIVLE